jgi:HEAT repeat protein
MTKVIAKIAAIAILIGVTVCSGAKSQTALDKRVDSLFTIASSGEIKFQPLVQPAVDSLGALGADAVPRLTSKFNTKSARERQALSNIFRKIGVPAVPYLLKSLSLESGVVVERICGVLGEIADTSATTGLLATAAHSRWQVREQTIGSLGRIEDHRADSVVMAALTDSIPLVRKSAAVSCGQLRIKSSIPALVHALGDSYYGTRMSAAASLVSIDTPQVVQTICDSLNSENRLLGNLGCEILGVLVSQAGIEFLAEQMFKGDTERRAHAAVALVKADPKDEYHYLYYYRAFETDRFNRLKVESAIMSMKNVAVQSK